MQIPLRTISTIDDYVAAQEWSRARLSCCPLHPNGGCTFRRHGSYARLTSPGVRIARYYCRQGRMTFSLLPDFLAARLPGSLAAIACIVGITASARSIEHAADVARGHGICLPGAVRWLRRRIVAVRRSVSAVREIAPRLSELLESEVPALTDLRRVLPPQILHKVPAPLGFRPFDRPNDDGPVQHLAPGVIRQEVSDMSRNDHRQHDTGPDLTVLAGYVAPMEAAQCSRTSIATVQLSLARPPPPRFGASGTRSGGLAQERRGIT
ncbi:MAG: hypothetical protein JO270_17685 [Acidobacteriaceae bacterium]|nr:hypothetical protein [Acidobacteriaceae bacterium]